MTTSSDYQIHYCHGVFMHSCIIFCITLLHPNSQLFKDSGMDIYMIVQLTTPQSNKIFELLPHYKIFDSNIHFDFSFEQ